MKTWTITDQNYLTLPKWVKSLTFRRQIEGNRWELSIDNKFKWVDELNEALKKFAL